MASEGSGDYVASDEIRWDGGEEEELAEEGVLLDVGVCHIVDRNGVTVPIFFTTEEGEQR